MLDPGLLGLEARFCLLLATWQAPALVSLTQAQEGDNGHVQNGGPGKVLSGHMQNGGPGKVLNRHVQNGGIGRHAARG